METFLTVLKLKMTIMAVEDARAGNRTVMTAQAIDIVIESMPQMIRTGQFGMAGPMAETCVELGIPCTVEAVQGYCSL